MQSAKRYVLTAASFALALTLFAVINPRAAHAFVATLVQVANTSANPVPNRDVDQPSNEPFSWEGIGSTSSNISFVVPTTTNDGRTVQRLVIEHVSSVCFGVSSPLPALRLAANGCFSSAGACVGSGTEIFFPYTPIASNQQSLSTPVRLYVDPGQSLSANLSGSASAFCSHVATGHFVTQ
jgi:hypothetical protein